MIVAGIDVGGKNLYIVIKKDGQIFGKGVGPIYQEKSVFRKSFEDLIGV